MKWVLPVCIALLMHAFAFWPQLMCDLNMLCSNTFQEWMLNLTAWSIAIHEFCHALAGWLTGAQVNTIEVHKLDGVTYTTGGIYPIISMMGYIGSNIVAVMLLKSTQRDGYKVMAFVFLSVFTALMLIFSKWSFSLAIALGMAMTAIFSMWKWKSSVYNIFLATLLVLESTNDVLTLLIYNTRQTDAGLLAQHIGMPFLAWPIALMYCAFGATVLYFGIQSLRRKDEKMAI